MSHQDTIIAAESSRPWREVGIRAHRANLLAWRLPIALEEDDVVTFRVFRPVDPFDVIVELTSGGSLASSYVEIAGLGVEGESGAEGYIVLAEDDAPVNALVGLYRGQISRLPGNPAVDPQGEIVVAFGDVRILASPPIGSQGAA